MVALPSADPFAEPKTAPDIRIPTLVLSRLPIGWHTRMGTVAIRWGLDRLPVRL